MGSRPRHIHLTPSPTHKRTGSECTEHWRRDTTFTTHKVPSHRIPVSYMYRIVSASLWPIKLNIVNIPQLSHCGGQRPLLFDVIWVLLFYHWYCVPLDVCRSELITQRAELLNDTGRRTERSAKRKWLIKVITPGLFQCWNLWIWDCSTLETFLYAVST